MSEFNFRAASEVVLPDFSDDEATATTTTTKSRRVSFGTNFIKEFIVGSAVSAKCLTEYEQAFSSSDTSNASSSQSAIENSLFNQHTFVIDDNQMSQKSVPLAANGILDPSYVENIAKISTFSSTICFKADSPTADMEFTGGCINLAKSILEKKNKEMTVIISSKPKVAKDDIPAREETKLFFDTSDCDMSMTLDSPIKKKQNCEDNATFTVPKTIKNKENKENLDFSAMEDGYRLMGPFKKPKFDATSNDTEWHSLFGSKEGPNFLDSSDSDSTLNLEAPISELAHEKKSDLNMSLELPDSEDMLVEGPISTEAQSVDFEKTHIKESGPSVCSKETALTAPVETSFSAETIRREPLSDVAVLSRISEETFGKEWPMNVAPETCTFEKTNMNEQSMNLTLESSNFEKPSADDQVLSLSVDSIGPEEVSTRQPPSNTDVAEPQLLEKEEDKKESSASVIPESLASHEIHVEEPFLSRTVELLVSEKLEIIESSLSMTLELPASEEKLIQDSPLSMPAELPVSEETPTKLTTTTNLTLELPFSEETHLKGLPSNVPLELSASGEIQVEETPSNLAFRSLISGEGSLNEPLSVTAADLLIPDETCKEEEPECMEDDLLHSKEAEPIESPPSIMPQSSTDSGEFAAKEPPFLDQKVLENLKTQSKENGCLWTVNDVKRVEKNNELEWIFLFRLFESHVSIRLRLCLPDDDDLDACCRVKDVDIDEINEERLRRREYRPMLDFGLDQMKKQIEKEKKIMRTVLNVPYFLDQMNSFGAKLNEYLDQVYSILTMYPGSRLCGSILSFRLFSFPLLFSLTVSVNLADLYGLSKFSLSYDLSFGSFDEKKISEIFENCLETENSLCEFMIRSTKYLIEMEKKCGSISKRSHICLLSEKTDVIS